MIFLIAYLAVLKSVSHECQSFKFIGKVYLNIPLNLLVMWIDLYFFRKPKYLLLNRFLKKTLRIFIIIVSGEEVSQRVWRAENKFVIC